VTREAILLSKIDADTIRRFCESSRKRHSIERNFYGLMIAILGIWRPFATNVDFVIGILYPFCAGNFKNLVLTGPVQISVYSKHTLSHSCIDCEAIKHTSTLATKTQ
jgi:hypothetical protein